MLAILQLSFLSLTHAISIPSCVPLDLTHTLDENVPIYPVVNAFKLVNTFRGEWGLVKYMEANDFSSSEHVGTHIDAPIHFSPGKQHIDEVPLDNLMGEGCVFDISHKTWDNSDEGLTIEDIKDWETIHGRIPRDAIILINSNWGHKWSNPELYLGTKNISDIASFHFPSFTAEAAEWLVNNRLPRAVGVDTMSLDMGHNTPTFPAHVILLSNNIAGAENLANIDKLPPRGSTIFLSPMKIRGGSGGPIRAFALGWRGNSDPCRRAASSIKANGIVIAAAIIIKFGYAVFIN